MSWIKLSEVHRCEFPEYDHEDRRSVGSLWRCDEPWCNRIWRLVSVIAKADGEGGWEGSYKFLLLDIDELHHWN